MFIAWYRVVRIVTGSLKLMKQLLRHSMARDVGVLVTSQYVVAGLGFMSSIVETRLLGPTAYGTAVLIMAYPTLIRSLIDVKSVDVTIRYMAGFRASGCPEEFRSVCKLGYIMDFSGSFGAFVVVSATFWWVARHTL